MHHLNRPRIAGPLAFASLLALGAACSSSQPGTTGGAGGSATGTGGSGTGGSATGGSATGGTVGTGGTIGTGGATGGSPGSGGTGGQVVSTGGAGGHGTGGAAGTTGGNAAGASGTCKYKLCEDFESGTAGGVPTGWTQLNGFGATTGVGLATDAAHGGSMSLKSSSSTKGQARVQRSLSALGATATKHWGRIFYKTDSPFTKPTSGVIHITLTALENPSGASESENRVVDLVEDTNGKHQWIFNVPDDSCCTGSSYDWGFDTAWHCAEWYVDQSTQSFRFFTDGTEVTQIGFTNNANAKMGAWTSIAVGAIFYQVPPTPVVVWFDDLAIHDTQIGCQ